MHIPSCIGHKSHGKLTNLELVEEGHGRHFVSSPAHEYRDHVLLSDIAVGDFVEEESITDGGVGKGHSINEHLPEDEMQTKSPKQLHSQARMTQAHRYTIDDG